MKTRLKINSKENLTIAQIGRRKFYIGIIVGLFSYLTIALFLVYGKELLKFFTTSNADIIIETPFEKTIYNYLFISLAYNYSLGIALWIWFLRIRDLNFKKKLITMVASLNNYVFPLICLWLLIRIGTIITFVLYGNGYNNELLFIENFKLLLILFPIVMFFQNWHTYQLVFKCNRWIIISLIVGIVSIPILSHLIDVN